MRYIITAFIFGTVFANSLLTGAYALEEGDGLWALWLIILPAIALVGLGSLLWEYRKQEHRRRETANASPKVSFS